MRTLPEKAIWSFGSIHNIFAYRTISNYRLSVISNIIKIGFVIIGVFTFFVIAKIEFSLCCFAVTFYEIAIMTMRTFNWRFTFRIRRELMMFCIINIFIDHAFYLFQKRCYIIFSCFNFRQLIFHKRGSIRYSKIFAYIIDNVKTKSCRNKLILDFF